MNIEKKLLHYLGRAVQHYRLIEEGDRIIVGVSGGKDSWVLLWLLHLLQVRAKVKFELVVGVVDFGFSNLVPLKVWLSENKMVYHFFPAIVDFGNSKKTRCVLCSRLRRGILYRFALENDFNKLALGHHREDLIVSLLMSMFYNGKIASMPPKWKREGLTVIRPLIYCQEMDLANYANYKKFPILEGKCPLIKEEGARERVTKWLKKLSGHNPKIMTNLLGALQNIHPDHLADRSWWDF